MGARALVPWDELASRVDIVEVVSEHVQLRRAGKDWVGLCPFHVEKTPSFTVSPDKQFFYCFGCQAGGDVYNFLMRVRGLDFREAAEEVARRAGVDLAAYGYNEGERQVWETRRRVLAACQAAWEIFRQSLAEPEAAPARRYLRQRRLDPPIIDSFGLGFAPEDSGRFWERLQGYGVSRSVAQEAGLLAVPRETRRGEAGGREGVVPGRGGASGQGGAPGQGGADVPLARFRGRLMFPIRDLRGQVVGFGARKLSEAAWGPKYLNSPQTPVFNKGEVLFGLWEARDAIRAAGHAVVVEGYMDVLALHQAGINQAVAALGTALTAGQARLLKRFTEEVAVAFDGDGAGEQAALRSLATLSAEGLRVRVLVLPRGHDPDTCVQAEGADGFRARLEQAVPLTEFRLKMALRGQRVDTVEGRARAVAAVLPVLADVTSAVELEGYVERLARALGVSQQALHADLEAFIAGRAGGRPGHPRGPVRHRLARIRHNMRGFVPAGGEVLTGAGAHDRKGVPAHGERRRAGDAQRRAERTVLRQMMQGPKEALSLWRMIGIAGFRDELAAAAARKLVERAEAAEAAPGGAAGGFLAPTGDGRVDALLEELQAVEAPGGDAARAWVRWLLEQRLRERFASIEGRLPTEAECAEDGRGMECLGRLVELLMEYHGVRLQVVAKAARQAGEGRGERLEP